MCKKLKSQRQRQKQKIEFVLEMNDENITINKQRQSS
jgi:hypothetical protein